MKVLDEEIGHLTAFLPKTPKNQKDYIVFQNQNLYMILIAFRLDMDSLASGFWEMHLPIQNDFNLKLQHWTFAGCNLILLSRRTQNATPPRQLLAVAVAPPFLQNYRCQPGLPETQRVSFPEKKTLRTPVRHSGLPENPRGTWPKRKNTLEPAHYSFTASRKSKGHFPGKQRPPARPLVIEDYQKSQLAFFQPLWIDGSAKQPNKTNLTWPCLQLAVAPPRPLVYGQEWPIWPNLGFLNCLITWVRSCCKGWSCFHSACQCTANHTMPGACHAQYAHHPWWVRDAVPLSPIEYSYARGLSNMYGSKDMGYGMATWR